MPGVSTSVSAVNRQALMHALQPLQEPFLAASLARMHQAVSGLYAPGAARTLPSAVTQCVGCDTEPFKTIKTTTELRLLFTSVLLLGVLYQQQPLAAVQR